MTDWINEVGSGWHSIVQPLIDQCKEENVPIAQVKEKWGGLRFYLDGNSSNKLHNMIRKAEEDSFTICEICGNPGKPRGGAWIKTYCDYHHLLRKERGVVAL